MKSVGIYKQFITTVAIVGNGTLEYKFLTWDNMRFWVVFEDKMRCWFVED